MGKVTSLALAFAFASLLEFLPVNVADDVGPNDSGLDYVTFLYASNPQRKPKVDDTLENRAHPGRAKEPYHIKHDTDIHILEVFETLAHAKPCDACHG